MVDNLKRFGVITASVVESGFRLVDRKFFVPKSREGLAHADQPLKEGNVHISAPHIYGSALEALELRADSSLSFLNVGSGTGYVSSIVAAIMGPTSSNLGVEIFHDVVKHSQAAVATWKSSLNDPSRIPPMEVLQGNALNINPSLGEACRGFDRIYIGASVQQSDLSKLTCLLKPGGILVGPVEDELVKVVRIRKSDGVIASDEDFTQQIISGVRFASLLTFPITEIVIPAKVWEPATHRFYPDSFRAASKELILCCYADYKQPLPQKVLPQCGFNLAATLPKAIWMEILSFTHRDWFEPPQTEANFLRQRLLEEQECSRKAHQALVSAEARLHVAERERDVYRLLARRWQTRLQNVVRQQCSEQMDVEADSDEDSRDIQIPGPEQAVMFGLVSMHRTFQSGSDASDDDEDQAQLDEEIDHVDELFHEDISDDEGNYQFSSADEENHDEVSRQNSVSSFDAMDDGRSQSISPASASALALRPQTRTVSITNDDL